MKYPYIGKCSLGVVIFANKDFGAPIQVNDGFWEGLEIGEFTGSFCEGVFKNITREYLANTYGEVESREHAEFIMFLAESNGIGVRTPYIDGRYFWFSNDIHRVLHLDFYDKSIVKQSSGKLINLPLPPKEEEKMFAKAHQTLHQSIKEIQSDKEEKPPVYTREMQKRGDFKIGMKYLNSDGQLCKMIGFTGENWHGKLLDHVTVDGYLDSSYRGDCKPIPTPAQELANVLAEKLGSTVDINTLELVAELILNDTDIKKHLRG